MNILYFLLALSVVFAVYVWYKRRQHYKGLPTYEKLWEDFIRTKGSDSCKIALSDYACKMLRTAESRNTLLKLSNEYSHYYRDRPFAFDGIYSYWGPEAEECFNQIEAELAEKTKQAYEANEVEYSKVEAERLKAAQAATTREEAEAILVGNYVGRASTNLAIKKMNRFSLLEVLAARTLEELKTAKDRAREGSLARKYVPFMYEKIAKTMVEHADTIDDLIVAAELAPTEALACNTALYISFLKIDARRHKEKK